MNLSNLHTRETVIKAIREYDRLGREAFLSKYGFGKAREYYLLHEGKYYDSKAITAVAYGYDNPSHGPLMSSEFSGGKNTVQNRLEKLGFTVVQMSSKPRKGKRNLNWSWAECYLAIWGYDKIDSGDYCTKKKNKLR